MLNQVFLIGNLTADPEVRATPGGRLVANVRLATDWVGAKDENGTRRQSTEFHHLVIWGRSAEVAGEYLRKGSLVFAEGRLQSRSWEDGDGHKHYATEVLVDRFQMLDRRAARPESEPAVSGPA